MIAYRETYGPIVAEQSDVAVLLDWSARSDAELFSQLIACTYSPLYQSHSARSGWSAGARRSSRPPRPAPRPAGSRTNLCESLRRSPPPSPWDCARPLDLALEADTEGDPIFAAWLYGILRVMDALYRPDPAWQARAQAVAAELRSSSDADVRDLAAILDAHLLLLQDRFDEAADAFEAAIRRGGETWAAETPVYMIGDCHLFAGRPQAALPAYARGRRRRPRQGRADQHRLPGRGDRRRADDLGRHDEALQTLGACDNLTGEGVLPREHNAFWGERDGGPDRVGTRGPRRGGRRLSVCARPRARRRGGRGTAVVIWRPGRRSVLAS